MSWRNYSRLGVQRDASGTMGCDKCVELPLIVLVGVCWHFNNKKNCLTLCCSRYSIYIDRVDIVYLVYTVVDIDLTLTLTWYSPKNIAYMLYIIVNKSKLLIFLYILDVVIIIIIRRLIYIFVETLRSEVNSWDASKPKHWPSNVGPDIGTRTRSAGGVLGRARVYRWLIMWQNWHLHTEPIM